MNRQLTNLPEHSHGRLEAYLSALRRSDQIEMALDALREEADVDIVIDALSVAIDFLPAERRSMVVADVCPAGVERLSERVGWLNFVDDAVNQEFNDDLLGIISDSPDWVQRRLVSCATAPPWVLRALSETARTKKVRSKAIAALG